jgi:N-acetylgalactosamine kinase
MLQESEGDWSNYVKAAALRLQHQYQDVQIPGMNVALTGSIPIAAGLSSSSSLVVATLQALIALNDFDLTSQQFVDLCGEGEWFVGSRGGSGDHAAITLGQRGRIAHIGYLPFNVERFVSAPENYQVIIADSHTKATKSATARGTFNAKVASSNIGLALLKQRASAISPVIEHVRDIDPEKLGCSQSEIYRLLQKVPESMTRSELRKVLSADCKELLESNFATHPEPESYGLRGVLLFGVAEIQRSRICVDLLDSGRMDEFGRLMRISHDGDRVSRPDRNGAYRRFNKDCSDVHLDRLIADLGSEDPARVLGAQLYMQPGCYGCSMPEIDRMVDIACSVPGVVGAQIAGAGLGGCIMILAHNDSVRAVRRALVREYYRPGGLKPDIIPCTAVEGAGLVEF